MSSLVMTEAEEKTIDSKVEQMMDWAKSRQAEAEQLAMDSARLLACTTERLDRLGKQNFFVRCWTRFNGDADAAERANVNDVIQMQKTAFRYVNMLQEQQMLMAHSLLSLKNNLISLVVKEEETRNLIGKLAQRTLERFEKLESRVDQLEVSTNLQGWLLGLEERDYDEKYPTEFMRLFRVLNDFYGLKNDDWNYNDLMFMRKAIRIVGLNPKQKLSLNSFINKLLDEIYSSGVGFDRYEKSISEFKPIGIDDYSKYAVDNISSPVFVSIHGLKIQYMDRLEMAETLQENMNISIEEALKILLRKSISNLNVNLDYEFPLAETAIELLGCIRLCEKLLSHLNKSIEIKNNNISTHKSNIKTSINIFNYVEDIKLFILNYNYNFKLLNYFYLSEGPIGHTLSYTNCYPYNDYEYTKNEDIILFIKLGYVKYIFLKTFFVEFNEKNNEYSKYEYKFIDNINLHNNHVCLTYETNEMTTLICHETPANYALKDILMGIFNIINKS